MKRKFITVIICMLMCVTVGSVTGIVNKDTSTRNSLSSITEPNQLVTPTQPTGRGDVLYDNGLTDGLNGLSCVAFSTYNREVIDDFQATGTWQVDGGIYYVVTNSGTPSVTGCKVSFFQDTGSGPSTTAYSTQTATIVCTLTGMTYFGRPEIKVTCSFPAVTLAPGKWWVCFQTQHTENCFTMTAPVKESSVFLNYPDQSYPRWTNGYVVFAAYHDLAWSISGAGGNNPPVTPAAPTGPSSGSTGISYSFSATTTDPDGDNISFMFDWGDGNMSSWLGPYPSGGTVTASYAWASAGTYNVKVKAKDSNDVESNWSSAHSIVIAAGPSVEIGAITGGLFKVKAVIKNTGAGVLTNVSWKIELTGGLIILGKSSTGTIATLNASGEITVSSKLILGFGKTVVKVTADTVTKSVNATVLLVFIKI